MSQVPLYFKIKPCLGVTESFWPLFMIKGQKDSVTPKQGFILKYKGTCDIKKLYKSSKDWFAKNNYKFSEKEFKEKWGPTGTEFKIHLEGERYVDEYLSFNIKIVFFII